MLLEVPSAIIRMSIWHSLTGEEMCMIPSACLLQNARAAPSRSCFLLSVNLSLSRLEAHPQKPDSFEHRAPWNHPSTRAQTPPRHLYQRKTDIFSREDKSSQQHHGKRPLNRPSPPRLTSLLRFSTGPMAPGPRARRRQAKPRACAAPGWELCGWRPALCHVSMVPILPPRPAPPQPRRRSPLLPSQ